MSAAKQKAVEPIIIIKKVKDHGGHHGGAWKVAYADFVTAMMALFIVLWLLSASEQVKKAVGGYFQDPSGAGKLAGTTSAGIGEALKVEENDLNALKEKIEKAMSQQVRDFDKLKDYVNITVTEEGLRIELLESAAGIFFGSGSPVPSPLGGDLFAKLAEQLGVLPNLVVIEGHTDARPYSRVGEYSNWELSTDRANAARRLMQQHGLRMDQVTQVRGYADQQLRKRDAPEDPSNRRISILVRKIDNVITKRPEGPAGEQAGGEKPKEETAEVRH
ncbi:MAG: flagellar motor protein MotB [Acidobacteriota bacterium]